MPCCLSSLTAKEASRQAVRGAVVIFLSALNSRCTSPWGNDGFLAAMRRQNKSSRLSEKEMLRLACNDGRQDQSQVVCGATGINRQIAFIAAQGLLPLGKGMALLNA
ncbi:hypothetical protein MJ579_17445 [Klebsiella pneumoniae]|nr:hypothetical protein MJ579_17445 [Klebsiella pneumoniae]